MSLKLNSSGGGSVTLQEPVTASNLTLTLPNATGTMVLSVGGTADSTTFLRGDQTWAAIGQIQVQQFTSTTTWTCPTGLTQVKVMAIGAGGGGAGSPSCGVQGSNGGLGGCGIGIYTVVPGTVYTVTVGAGGTGSNTASGTAGGESWFGVSAAAKLVSATGGGGGVYNVAAGANGVSTNGTLRTTTTTYNGIIDGANSRGAAASSTAPLVWSISSNIKPGSNGNGEDGVSANNSAGGLGGMIYMEYVA